MHPPQVIALISPLNLDDSILAPELAMANLWEIRGDLWGTETDFTQLIAKVQAQKTNQKIIFTLRLVKDGGLWPNEMARERQSIWRHILRESPMDWLDIECEQGIEQHQILHESIRELQPQVNLLISHHDFHSAGDLQRLQDRYQAMQSPFGDAYKMALTFDNPLEEDALKQLIQSSPPKLISCFSMGSLGQNSRRMAPLWGAPWTYGYVGEQGSAPGQIRVKDLYQFYHGQNKA